MKHLPLALGALLTTVALAPQAAAGPTQEELVERCFQQTEFVVRQARAELSLMTEQGVQVLFEMKREGASKDALVQTAAEIERGLKGLAARRVELVAGIAADYVTLLEELGAPREILASVGEHAATSADRIAQYAREDARMVRSFLRHLI